MDAPFVEGYLDSKDLFLRENTLPIPEFRVSSQNQVSRSNDPIPEHGFLRPPTDPHHDTNNTSPSSSGAVLNSDSPDSLDFPDDCLKFMTEILMEDDLDGILGSFIDYDAMQATEKSLFDALSASTQGDVPNTNVNIDSNCSIDWNLPDHYAAGSNSSTNSAGFDSSAALCVDTGFNLEYSHPSLSPPGNFSADSTNGFGAGASPVGLYPPLPQELISQAEYDSFGEACKYMPSSGCPNNTESGGEQSLGVKHGEVKVRGALEESLASGSSGKNRSREEENDLDMMRSNKSLASSFDDYEQMTEEYDDALVLWEDKKDDSRSIRGAGGEKTNGRSKSSKGSKKRGGGGKKPPANQEGVVDLSTLLTHCAQAVAGFDLKTGKKLLEQIRLHSNPCGTSIERLAYYFSFGLEARLVGNTSALSVDPVVDIPVSPLDVLKTHKTYFAVNPLKRSTYFVANETIGKLTKNATRIHIIDFGIFLGFQWPCFIHALSGRKNGPPKLRITGVGFPQRGFRPAALIEEAGRRLAGYCERFGVPFEYHCIAKNWDAIRPEDIHLDRDELTVVNCLYESRTLLDDTVEVDCPRDAFLRLVRELKPDLFIHGIINGSFNSPFFMTRFKEAYFHYSTIFDMMGATIPAEDPERMMLEKNLYGRAAMNVIACEGVERLERPETYKQWQIRTRRAGLRIVPLDVEVMDKVKKKVRLNYHKDFVIGEDSHWMLQGWKGRILYALSFWTPT